VVFANLANYAQLALDVALPEVYEPPKVPWFQIGGQLMAKSNRQVVITCLCVLILLIGMALFSSGASRSRVSTAQQNNPKQSNSSAPTSSQANRRGQSLSDIKGRFPKVDYDAPEPQDPGEKERRRNKGKHFDNRGGVDKQPTHLSAGLNNHWDTNLPSLPVKESTSIVIAETLNRGAFLSNDRMAVYTELAVKVEKVLKGNDVSKGQQIDINRQGGVVRYKTGEESLFFIVGQNMPDVGKRYLFFLTTLEDSPDFQIVTGYELSKSGVQALDDPRQFTQYNSRNVDDFVAEVQKAIETPQ
jgi:hypothetical protein